MRTRIHPDFHKSAACTCTDSACSQEFISTPESTTGSFGSPLYPDPYPAYVMCRFFFRGRPGERVQISFIDLDLSYTAGDPNDTLIRFV